MFSLSISGIVATSSGLLDPACCVVVAVLFVVVVLALVVAVDTVFGMFEIGFMAVPFVVVICGVGVLDCWLLVLVLLASEGFMVVVMKEE